MIQLTLTLKMTTIQVVETSVTVNNNSPIQDYVHVDDRIQPTYEMTPRFKPFALHKVLERKMVLMVKAMFCSGSLCKSPCYVAVAEMIYLWFIERLQR